MKLHFLLLTMDWEARIPILRLHDWMLAPIYIFLICVVALLLRKKYARRIPEAKKYFLPALSLRIFGCFCFSLLYQFYYNGGDTWAYHWGGISIWRSFWENPLLFFQIMLNSAEEIPEAALYLFEDTQATWYIRGDETFMVMKVAALLYFLTFQSYLGAGFILALFSLIACWKIFEVFVDLYPSLYKHFAYGILFMPSVFFWGAAGLTKDTIVLTSLGFSFWGFYQFFFKKRHRFKSAIYFLVGIYLMFIIKIYVVLALLPALLVWLILKIAKDIKNKTLRYLFRPLFFGLGLIGALLLFQRIGSGSKNYSVDGIVKYAAAAQNYLKYQTERSGGVGYDLGEYEKSFGGLITMIPKSIHVTLFRPYPWEAKKPMLLPSVLEAIVSFFLTIFVIFKVGFFRTLKAIFNDNTLIFCLIFSLLFSFAVGFTSYNFGSLSRYKILALPFYFSALAIIYLKHLQRVRRIRYKKSLLKDNNVIQ